MSKLEEEFKVLEVGLQKYTTNSLGCEPLGTMTDFTAKQCVEITEQECIGFAEWLPQNANPLAPNLGEWQIFGDKKVYKTDEIFQLYQKSKESITITAHGVTKYADETQKSKENE